MTSEETQTSGFHRRFDEMRRMMAEIQTEQHGIVASIQDVNHRVDLTELQLKASQEREAIVTGHLFEKLGEYGQSMDRLTAGFAAHTAQEDADRKKILFWLATTVVSVAGSAGLLLFNKVFGT